VLLVGAALSSACVGRAPDDPTDGAGVRIVAAFEAAIAEQEFGPAHAAMDYAYRLDEVLGDMWRAGTDEDRDDLIGLSRGMLEDTTARYWSTCCAGRTMARSLERREGDDVWIKSEVVGDPKGFRWLYRLSRRGDGWRITQREYMDNHVLRSNSTRFWPMAIKKIASDFGRAPTLRELTANLPSVMGTIRSRVFRVPETPRNR
jgi:hypothetical protein